MNVSEFLSEIRGILDDPVDAVNNPDQKFSDALILSHLTRHVQGLCRVQVHRDQGFHNFPIVLFAADAKQVIQNVYQWTLPPWVVNVCRIRIKLGGADSVNEISFSPFRWTSKVILSDELQKKSKFCDYGWKWDGNRTLQLWGEGSIPSLYVEVVKLPARLFRATIDQVGVDAGRLYLPPALSLGTEDRTEGAYCNGEIQITTSTDLMRIGKAQRCIYSSPNVDSGGAVRKSELYFEYPFPSAVAIGDVIESVIPYGEEHARLLLLKTAWSCFERLANIPAQKAIASDLADEMTKFNDYVTPRDTAQAESWHQPIHRRGHIDHDRALGRSYFV